MPMTGSTTTKTVNIDVSGGQTLTLIVKDFDGIRDGDHADWADAGLSCDTSFGPLPVLPPASNDSKSNHPKIYYARFQYDPNNNFVTLINSGFDNADKPKYIGDKPNPDPTRFLFYVENISSQNVIVNSGWKSLPIDVIKLPDNTLLFGVEATYKPGAKLKVYSADKALIWTGIMP